MNVFCPQCGAVCETDDVNLSALTARCRDCDSEFPLDRFFDDRGMRARHEGTAHKNVMPPSSMRMSGTGRDLCIVYRWYSPSFIFLAVFSAVSNSFLVFFYRGIGGFSNVDGLAMLIIVCLSLAGIGMAYYTICGFVNRTIIATDGKVLHVRHRPMPWIAATTVTVDEIDQIYCREGYPPFQYGNGRIRYEVAAMLKGGNRSVVLHYFSDIHEALFLEQRLERFLGIEDAVVPGEIPV